MRWLDGVTDNGHELEHTQGDSEGQDGASQLSFSVAGLWTGGGQGSLLMLPESIGNGWGVVRAGRGRQGPSCQRPPATAGVAIAGLLHGDLALLFPG